MKDNITQGIPETYSRIFSATEASGFTMSSDMLTCSLLKTLAATKPSGSFLELGTGTGLSTAWILEGMDATSKLISVDNDEKFLKVAADHLSHDARLTLVKKDGGEWINENNHQRFDYIFADTWPGKYFFLEETLAMLSRGGLYIIDDMLPQANWPEGHDLKAQKLLEDLDGRMDLVLTRMAWASGIVVAVKK